MDDTVVAVSVSLPRLDIWSERKVDAYNFPGEWMDGWAGFKKRILVNIFFLDFGF